MKQFAPPAQQTTTPLETLTTNAQGELNMFRRSDIRNSLIRGAALAVAAASLGLCVPQAIAQGASGNQLFPQPFVVEHHIEQTDEDGSVFVGDAVVDHYGGSWIVSKRPDASRLIVDFSRRELTEIWPERGAYSVLSFGRLTELQRRLRAAENPSSSGEIQVSAANQRDVEDGEDASPPEFTFEESEIAPGSGIQIKAAGLRSQPRHLTVRLQTAEKAESDQRSVDVWLDRSVRLSPAAQKALSTFETEVLAAPEDEVPSTLFVAAARAHTQGSFPVRTRRTVGNSDATVEDIVTRLEAADSFSADLVSVPDGFRRIPHPLERVVAFMEDEAEYEARARAAVESADEGGLR